MDLDAARRALAPTGKLRVALFEGNPVHAVRDRSSGELKGIGLDLGRALAARLGVPYEPVLYQALGPMLDGAKTGAWDAAFLGASPERREFLDFAPHHLEVEYGFLVPAHSPIGSIAEVDRSGVRIAVVARGSPDTFFTTSLKAGELVRAAGLPPALDLVKTQKADVLAGLKPAMYGVSSQLPGSRVLPGSPGAEPAALAIPKGRAPAAGAYARQFIADVKASGAVQAAIDRAAVKGVVVAP